MFELCIEESDALLRHRAAPLAAERERFITHMLECGSSRTNARTAAAHLLRFVYVLPMNKLRSVSEKELNNPASRWINNRQRYSNHRPGPSSILFPVDRSQMAEIYWTTALSTAASTAILRRT